MYGLVICGLYEGYKSYKHTPPVMPEIRTYLSRIHSAMSSPKLAGEERDSLFMELMEYDYMALYGMMTGFPMTLMMDCMDYE